MLNIWFFSAIAFMCVNWLSVWFGWKAANYLSKPALILALIAWFYSIIGFSFPSQWFAIGLVFALAGDVLLLFQGKYFLIGMISFMLMQIAYIAGFNQAWLVITPAIAALALISLALWLLLYITLRRGARENPAFRKLEIPLIIYNLMIMLMVISALTTNFRPEWPRPAAVLVSCGALLFLFSDALLGADRFIRPLPNSRLWKRVTYQLGQLAIIAGVLLTFSA